MSSCPQKGKMSRCIPASHLQSHQSWFSATLTQRTLQTQNTMDSKSLIRRQQFATAIVIHYCDSNLDAVFPAWGKGAAKSARIAQNTTAVAKHYDFHRDSAFSMKGPFQQFSSFLYDVFVLEFKTLRRKFVLQTRHPNDSLQLQTCHPNDSLDQILDPSPPPQISLVRISVCNQVSAEILTEESLLSGQKLLPPLPGIPLPY